MLLTVSIAVPMNAFYYKPGLVSSICSNVACNSAIYCAWSSYVSPISTLSFLKNDIVLNIAPICLSCFYIVSPYC